MEYFFLNISINRSHRHWSNKAPSPKPQGKSLLALNVLYDTWATLNGCDKDMWQGSAGPQKILETLQFNL